VGAPNPKTVVFSNSGSGKPWGYVSGSGSGSGSGFRPGETTQGLRIRANGELAVQRARFNAHPASGRYAQLQAERHEALLATRARQNAQALRDLLNSGGDPGYLVPDPQGIGTRGYIDGGINQPYARELAAELRKQDVAG